MGAVMEYIIDEYETLYRRSFSEEEMLWIEEWFAGLYETMDVYEIYNQILEENGWNQTKTAKVLGIQRTYVVRLINELNIRVNKV
jgi:transcriptional regulator with GAF, ATPase, and Fis domain